jgi:hypothetical protein
VVVVVSELENRWMFLSSLFEFASNTSTDLMHVTGTCGYNFKVSSFFALASEDDDLRLYVTWEVKAVTYPSMSLLLRLSRMMITFSWFRSTRAFSSLFSVSHHFACHVKHLHSLHANAIHSGTIRAFGLRSRAYRKEHVVELNSNRATKVNRE